MQGAGAGLLGVLVLALAAAGDELPRRALVGVQVVRVVPQLRAEHKVPAGVRGALVNEVVAGSAAAGTELERGDVIVSVNGAATENVAAFMEAVAGLRGGAELTLDVQRGADRRTVRFTVGALPHEEQSDFDIIYGQVRSGDARLRTIITRPRVAGRRPGVLLIQGLGCFTVDNPIGAPTDYQRILYELTRRGFVTLRVDKPGTGDSEGGPCLDSDFEQVLDGYRQGLAALKELEYVDEDRVFIFGHSMGGIIGPLLAAETPVRGLVVYGTTARTWIEYTLENTRRQAQLSRNDHAEIEQQIRDDTAFMAALYVAGKSPDAIVADHPELATTVTRQITRGKYMYGRHYKFFQQLYGKPLAASWAKCGARVLALWGESDFISAGPDHQLIADIVNRANPGYGTYRALPGVDHWFKRAATPEATAASAGRGTFEPAVLDAMWAWLEEQSRAE